MRLSEQTGHTRRAPPGCGAAQPPLPSAASQEGHEAIAGTFWWPDLRNQVADALAGAELLPCKPVPRKRGQSQGST